jgi:hypothetical protein
MGFLHKLHIIYLINDVLHNAARKTTLNVKSQLQGVIIPIYCHTFVGESHENQQRCEKVVRIWETNSYFDSDVIEVQFQHAAVLVDLSLLRRSTHRNSSPELERASFIKH